MPCSNTASRRKTLSFRQSITSTRAWHNVKNSEALTTASLTENNIKLGASRQNYRKSLYVFAATSKQAISHWRREGDGGLLSARMLSTLPEAVSSVPVAVAVARSWLAKGRYWEKNGLNPRFASYCGRYISSLYTYVYIHLFVYQMATFIRAS